MDSDLHQFTYWATTKLLDVLPQLLRLYWILASSSVLLTLLPLPIPRTFKAAVRLAAARGKLWHDRPDAPALGLLKNASVPQQYFEHFYMIGALLNTVLLQLYIFVCCEDAPGSTRQRDSLLALLLFEVHLLRRYYETAYVLHYLESARMHLLAYLFGLSYYIAVPLTLLPSSVLNMDVMRTAWTRALGEGTNHWQSVDQRLAEAVTSPHPGVIRLAGGVVLFLFANLLQYVSHRTLGHLSRDSDKRVQEARVAAALFRKGTDPSVPTDPSGGVAITDVYCIPKGGAFELVSCPHYLAEILIYVALAIVTRGSQGPLLILAWVVLNLVLAAGATQSWYRRHFKEYPRRRAALVPLLF